MDATKMEGDGVKAAMEYLVNGGLGETTLFAYDAMASGHPKVQMETDMAVALLLLADEAIKARKNTLLAS